MNPKIEMNKVGLVVFIILLITAFVDLFLVIRGVDQTISHFFVTVITEKASWVVFVMGLTAGHLFFPMQKVYQGIFCSKCGDKQ